MKRMMLAVAMTVMGFALSARADVVVTDVIAKQRYPWNGLVDITCKVTGIDGTANGLNFAVAAVMPDSGNVRNVSHFWVEQGGTNSTGREIHTNGDYRLLWDARADLGTIRYTNMVVRVTFDAHERVQLWEGGPYWATTNIGAERPEEFGYYFWWGDTIGYKREGNAWVASDGSSSNFLFDEDNTLTYNKSISTLQSEGWITENGALAPEHDAAQVHWGGEWRMPKNWELHDLYANCDWTFTTMNGVSGYVVRGRGDYASSSIFLPAAGTGWWSSLNVATTHCLYWSCIPYPGNDDARFAHELNISVESGYNGRSSHGSREYGRSIRPVQGFTE